MRRSLVSVVLSVLLVALVACGGSDGSDSIGGPTSTPVTTVTAAGLSAPPTVAPPPASPSAPNSTIAAASSSTVPSTATSIVDPTVPSTAGPLVLGLPDVALLPAAPPGEIDWGSVGTGWLLIDHGPYFAEPTTLDQRGLYLVAPDDAVYAVSALATDGSLVAAASVTARQILLELFDPVCADGCTCPAGAPVTVETDERDERDDRDLQSLNGGFALLDLATTSLRTVIEPVAVPVCAPGSFSRDVEFAADGNGIWVSETWYSELHHGHPSRVRLSRVEIVSGAWTTVLDEPVAIDLAAPAGSSWISVVELDHGQIVTSAAAGIWLREGDGTPLRQLGDPGGACRLDRTWGSDHVLASCTVPAGDLPTPPEVPAEQCHARGLWLIAIDGSPAQVLALPLDDRGYLTCWTGYAWAEPNGEAIAVQVGGDGCSDDVVIITADGGRRRWSPDIADPCTELLIGVRNGAWLIGADSESGDGGVFEVTTHESTAVELPPGRIITL